MCAHMRLGIFLGDFFRMVGQVWVAVFGDLRGMTLGWDEPHFRLRLEPHARLMLEPGARAPYLEPAVEAELTESAELVRDDLTRSLE